MKRLVLFVAFAASFFALATTASAQYTETTIYNFGAITNDTNSPSVGLIRDAAGNLYGTSNLGGTGQGTAFELSFSGGSWTETILHNFGSVSGDGLQASGGLIRDSSGNLYGVTQAGGANNQGTVYELSPNSSGWTETILYSFAGNPDVREPSGSLIFDAAGNLYGTSFEGGGGTNANCFDGCGTVFELSPSSSGWTEKIIYAFTGGGDGMSPGGNLLFDSAGALYGSAAFGGSVVGAGCFEGCGTVFRLTPVSGTWRFARLFNFQGPVGGAAPLWLVFDAAQNIYGVASAGGSGCPGNLGCGTIFKLTRQTSPGPWKETVLHSFTELHDGGEPGAGLVFDSSGNLFGSADFGGNGNLGTVWELSPTAHGPWKLTQLYSFGDGTTGSRPNSGVIIDPSGNLYGTAQQGGQFDRGTVFELSPPDGRKSN
jgi:uncharacterized repeat protein (TIGR03803 family)